MRLIFHIDVNSAFLSWTAQKLLEEDPESVDLRTIPAIIGGDEKPATELCWPNRFPLKNSASTRLSLWPLPCGNAPGLSWFLPTALYIKSGARS